MTLPLGPVQMPQDTITAYIRNMQAQVDEATRQTLYSAVVSAGGLTIRQGGAFIITNAFGTYNVLETKTRTFSDGTQYQPVVINRPPTGEPAFSIYPAGSTAASPFYWSLFDRAGHLVLTDDALSGVGLAKPFLGVPMTIRFAPEVNGGSPVPGQYSGGYAVAQATASGSNVLMWEGRMPFCSHPKLAVNGVWGGSGSVGTVTYTLNLGGTNYTWTASGLDTTEHVFDVTGQFGITGSPLQLSASWSGSGDVYCSVNAVYLRGT